MKKKLTHSLPAKIIAFFLLVITASMILGSALAAFWMVDYEFYTKSENRIKTEIFSEMSRSDGRTLLYSYLRDDTDYINEFCNETNVGFEVLVDSEKEDKKIFPNNMNRQTSLVIEHQFDKDEVATVEQFVEESYTVKIYIDDAFPQTDKYSFSNQVLTLVYSLRYGIWIIGLLSLLSSITLFIFLLCAAGHKAGYEDIVANGDVTMPFDLYLGIYAAAVVTVIAFVNANLYGVESYIAIALGVPALLILMMLFSINFAVRIKLGRWWENTIFYRLILLTLRILKAVWICIVRLLRNLPLIWKTLILVSAGSLILLLSAMSCNAGHQAMLWLVFNVTLVPFFLYIALVLRKLQKGSEALATGDLSYQVKTRWMFWDFRRAGENLNQIADGMTQAVDERMRSERFKTELITNVSHDIKTPLTSIINYADLIGKETIENEKINEYTEVLLRQSERLKKLIEDLVEASKASTGSIDVHLAPCEIGVLLVQTVGEYEQKLSNAGLELVVNKPEEPVIVLADGRQLWRVFDNLMNNVCKYAQNGTRVYIAVEEYDKDVVIIFKNTSKYPLNISAEELMERFVRGDSSRNSGGNGLGLSIARSLSELQNGKLALTIDGDLFKVTLNFNKI